LIDPNINLVSIINYQCESIKIWSIWNEFWMANLSIWQIIITAFTFLSCWRSVTVSIYTFVLYWQRHLSSAEGYTNMSYCNLCGIRSQHNNISKGGGRVQLGLGLNIFSKRIILKLWYQGSHYFQIRERSDLRLQ
jgi:hypothetical protein